MDGDHTRPRETIAAQPFNKVVLCPRPSEHHLAWVHNIDGIEVDFNARKHRPRPWLRCVTFLIANAMVVRDGSARL